MTGCATAAVALVRAKLRMTTLRFFKILLLKIAARSVPGCCSPTSTLTGAWHLPSELIGSTRGPVLSQKYLKRQSAASSTPVPRVSGFNRIFVGSPCLRSFRMLDEMAISKNARRHINPVSPRPCFVREVAPTKPAVSRSVCREALSDESSRGGSVIDVIDGSLTHL